MSKKKHTFTVILTKTAKWYLGWVEEIPGVNTQGKTLKEVRENLKEAIFLVLDTNKKLLARDLSQKTTTRETLSLSI